MNTSESIFSMQFSNLLSGFVGALLGALSSFAIAIYTNKKAIATLEVERLRSHVASAVILAGQLFDAYLSFNPHRINQSIFGVPIEEKSLNRMKYSIQLHGEAKYLEHLLPQILRHRWDVMLVLIAELSAMEKQDDVTRNRAQVDVDHYIQYVRDSCVDYLDGREVRIEVKGPYLRRKDAAAWMPPEIH
jgi:hypothetical protein